MLNWIYRRYSFWGLACYACGGRDGWHIRTSSWRSLTCVATATCPSCGAMQFLKKYRTAAIRKRNGAQREYQVLNRLADYKGGEASVPVPRAYNVSPTACALSMEYLHGQPMDTRMQLAQGRDDFDDCLRASAGWLRHLHAIEPTEGKTGNAYEPMLRRLESDCAALARRHKNVAQALAVMHSGLKEIKTVPIRHVLLHGDFKASNLIRTEEGVYGIDVGLRFKNPGAMDWAQFIADVLLCRPKIPVIARDRDITPILNVFLKAYGDNSEHIRRVTVWWLLYFVLSRWEEELQTWKPTISVDRAYTTVLNDVMSLRGAGSLDCS